MEVKAKTHLVHVRIPMEEFKELNEYRLKRNMSWAELILEQLRFSEFKTPKRGIPHE
jgi:hypothetical protein